MKNGENRYSDILRKRYLEIIAIIIFIIAIAIFVYTFDNPRDFFIAIPIMIVVLPILLYLTRRTLHGKTQEKSIIERAKFRDTIPETMEKKMSQQAKIDRVPGKGSGPSYREWKHEMRVEKRSFYGDIGSLGDQSYAIETKKALRDYIIKEPAKDGTQSILSHLSEIVDDKTLTLMDEVKQKLQDIDVKNLRFYIDDSGLNFSFSFPKRSKYNFIIGVIVQVSEKNTLVFESILKKNQLNLSLHKLESEESKKFEVSGNSSLDWTFLKNAIFTDGVLFEVYDILEYLTFDRKHLQFGLKKPANLEIICDIVLKIYNELVKI